MSEALSCHVPVMSAEVIDSLNVEAGGKFLDCTLGGGGHTEAILSLTGSTSVVACDRDLNAIDRAKKRLAQFGDRIQVQHCSFSSLDACVGNQKFNGILADLGISSDQLTEQRGFSFKDLGPLDMRMDHTQELTADEIVNQYTHSELMKVFKQGGLTKEAKPLVNAIVRERPIADTQEFAELVRSTLVAYEHGKTRDVATVAFQALRIAVNKEYEEIQALLELVPGIVESGARFLCISFHSSEDALVTKTMRRWQGSEQMPALHPDFKPAKVLGELKTKKALMPSAAELATNPRARSARMRVFEFH